MPQPTIFVFSETRPRGHRSADVRRSSVSILALALALGGMALTGCSDLQLDDTDASPLFSANENTPIQCSDGIDNDDNGFTDCDDPQCTDRGMDNDPDCENAPCPGRVVCLTTEDTDRLCNDGLDNDANGFIDCEDFGCTRSPNVTICCTATSQEESTAEECDDGIDNDCNGFADCADFGCLGVATCCTPTGPEGSDDVCQDGIDNDCNGYTDCDDFGCSQSQTVTVCAPATPPSPERDEETCSDGIDNDRDGYVDCADFDCAPKGVESPFEYCREAEPEGEGASCTDGVDNDRDGLIDCDEWRCIVSRPDECGQ